MTNAGGHDARCRPRGVGLSLLLLAALAAPARGSGAACDLGWYVLDGGAGFEGGAATAGAHRTETGSAHGRAISLVGTRLGIDGVCEPTEARVRAKRRRTKVRASWPRCTGLPGPVRFRAAIDADGCARMRGVLRVKGGTPRRVRFTATRTPGDPAACVDEDTFATLQARIFGAKGCRVATCHGAAQAGGLDLRYGTAHFSLVGQPAVGTVDTLRVAPGDPEASFLWRKLTGDLREGEGAPMPAVGRPLGALELEVVRAWIAAGAPAVGRVPGAPCLPPPVFEPATPLPPPPGGHQLVLDGPVLQPGEELEGCLWTRVPGTGDFAVGAWEFSLNPGTHHFAIWEHVRGAEPIVDEFRAGDVACIQSGAPVDGRSISGAGEAPYYVDAYPPGTGRVLRGGQLLGLNPHYFNEFDVPVQVKIWINLHPVSGPLLHPVETLLSGFAPFGANNAYNFSVPPFATGTHRLRMHNTLGRPMAIIQLSSHQHQRGTRFTAWRSTGEKIFENFDWAHPALRNFDDPLLLADGDWIDFECEWDNGVTRPVRRCGDAATDTGCTPGEPVAVTFGITAQDEMCFLTGQYYLP